MKKLTQIAAVLLTAFLLFGCSKDENNDNSTNPGGNIPMDSFQAKVDGNLFSSEDAIAISTLVENQSTLTLTAVDETDESGITFTLFDFCGKGEYALQVPEGDGGSFANYYIGSDSWGYTPGIQAGKLIISDFKQGESIKGTFFFQGAHHDGTIKNITEGAFNIIALHFQ